MAYKKLQAAKMDVNHFYQENNISVGKTMV
jgi:hypothetical protein